MESKMVTQKRKDTANVFNKKLRYTVVIFALLGTVGVSSSGYAYQHSLLRDTHDAAVYATRRYHDGRSVAARVAEDGASGMRRALAVHRSPTTEAIWDAEDLFIFFKRNIRDTYVDLKRESRDVYVSIKREVEDVYNSAKTALRNLLRLA
jgi:hypothetical protein